VLELLSHTTANNKSTSREVAHATTTGIYDDILLTMISMMKLGSPGIGYNHGALLARYKILCHTLQSAAMLDHRCC
jgi:hypothetical protein